LKNKINKESYYTPFRRRKRIEGGGEEKREVPRRGMGSLEPTYGQNNDQVNVVVEKPLTKKVGKTSLGADWVGLIAVC